MKRKGQTIGEWALIVGLVSVFSMFTWFSLADDLKVIADTLINSLGQASQQN